MKELARFRHRQRIFDLFERLRELARERQQKLRESINKNVRERVRDTAETTQRNTEKAKTFNIFARMRQRFRLEQRDIYFKLETFKTYAIDVLRAKNITTTAKITNAVRQAISRVRAPDFSVLYELTRCVARYQSPPCGSKKYYVKVTYSTAGILKQLVERFVLYVRNAIDNAKLRNRLLNVVALVIHSLRRSRTKSRTEHYNSEYMGNTNSTLDDYDSVSIAKSDVTNTERKYQLGFLMRHPSLIARSLAVKLGLHEFAGDGIHCSIYAMPAYHSKRKHYRELPPEQQYDYIVYETIEKMKGIT